MKKLLLIAIIFLAFSSKAHAGVYANQSTTTSIATSVTTDLGFTTPVKQGSLLYVCIQIIGTREVTITDNMNNTWQLAASSTSVTNSRQMYIFYAKNATAGYTDLTITTTGGTIGKRIVGLEYVGVDPINAFNASSTNAQDSQPYQNTGTVSSSGTLLTSCFGESLTSVVTIYSPWTKRIGQADTTAPSLFIMDALVSSSTPSGYVTTVASSNYTSALVTFNVASVPKFIWTPFTRFPSFIRL